MTVIVSPVFRSDWDTCVFNNTGLCNNLCNPIYLLRWPCLSVFLSNALSYLQILIFSANYVSMSSRFRDKHRLIIINCWRTAVFLKLTTCNYKRASFWAYALPALRGYFQMTSLMPLIYAIIRSKFCVLWGCYWSFGFGSTFAKKMRCKLLKACSLENV